MKNIVKILTALAAVAGAVYIIATYGEKIVAWAKQLWSAMPQCPACEEAEVVEEYTEEAAAEVGGEIRQTLWSSYYDAELRPVAEQAQAYYEVHVLPENSGVDGLGKAGVEVVRFDGNEALFFIPVTWQEVDGNG